MAKGRGKRDHILQVKVTANPEVMVGNMIGLTFQCVQAETEEPMTIQVLMPTNPAAALLALLTQLKDLGVLPDPPGDVEFHRHQ